MNGQATSCQPFESVLDGLYPDVNSTAYVDEARSCDKMLEGPGIIDSSFWHSNLWRMSDQKKACGNSCSGST